MSDLKKLIAAVENGDLHPLDLLCLDATSHGRAQKAFDGSLDAAKALHEALLPGYTRDVDATAPECGVAVNIWHPEGPIVGRGDMPCEARAWLLAVLRAYAAQQGPTP